MPCFRECTKSLRGKTIVLSEKGKSARIENPEGHQLNRTQFDGCVDCAGRRADYVISKGGEVVIIELKGKNVTDAEDQIINTASFLRREGLAVDKPSVLIVCARVPLGVSAVQGVTKKLKREGIGTIKIKSREWRGQFESLVR